MTDNSLIPISDEQAKLGQEIVGAGRDLGGYVTGILGDLPKDLVGLLIGDKVKVRRAERLAELWSRAKRRLREQGITEPESPGLNLLLPILAGAADENRQELLDLWARLFAASMHPDQSKFVRLGFAEALRKLDPLDARAMVWIGQHGGGINQNRNIMAAEFGVTRDEVDISLRNLVKAEFAVEINTGFSA
jgi:hypothetical protein